MNSLIWFSQLSCETMCVIRVCHPYLADRETETQKI